MFLDKLWLRIRGELILLREDLSAGADMREKAALLLDKLEERLALSDPDAQLDRGEGPGRRSAIQEREPETEESGSLDDIRREWQELAEQRDKTEDSADEEKPPPPNPRVLG